MAQGPRHLAESFVSAGVRKTAQTLSAAEQAQVRDNLDLGAASEQVFQSFTVQEGSVAGDFSAGHALLGDVKVGSTGTPFTGMWGGSVTLASGTVTITNAAITASSNILVTRTGGTIAATTVTFKAVPGVGSAVVTARSSADALVNTDTSVLSYLVFNS